MRGFGRLLLAIGLSAAVASPAGADAPARGTVLVHHAWQDYLLFSRRAKALADSTRQAELLPLALATYAGPDRPLVHAYFAWLGAGDAQAALGEWLESSPIGPGPLWLGDPTMQARLRAFAAEFARRLSRVVPPGDTVHVLLVVGGSSEPSLTYDAGARPVVAAPLDALRDPNQPPVGSQYLGLDPLLDDLFPWCAYAAASLFLPELRERKLGDSASLAEMVLLNGFSARFAGALYPESKFAGGRPLVSKEAYDAVQPRWREIGGAWFPLGTEPYLSAVYEDSVTAAVPEGVTVEQAAAVVGSALAGEWLDAARVSRTKDEAAEISRLGRFPTLYAWGLLRP